LGERRLPLIPAAGREAPRRFQSAVGPFARPFSPDRDVGEMTSRPAAEPTQCDGSAQPSQISLEGLYRRHARWLQGALRRRFGAALGESAEELVQEAYIRAAPYCARGQLRQPRAFLMQVATNLAHDHLRRIARQGGVVAIEELGEKAEHAVKPEQDETVLLKQLILRLPENLRDVFVLSRFSGMTNQDIAIHCGVSVKTVEWRMTRALAHIAEGLRR
jgi:RNA polymerase sigma factor (sigma-70 family)